MHRLALTALALAVAAPLAAQQSRDSSGNTFDWSGQIAPGAWLRVNNLNGSIAVEESSGATAEVHAEKSWRHGDPAVVHFAVVKDGGDVRICALWGDNSSCDAEGMHSHGDRGTRDNDVSVKFTVKLPKGVKVGVSTVNGGLDVAGAAADVDANTVNGRIDAATSGGPVRANTVNGSITVRMTTLPGSGSLEYHTVNGSITAELPANLNADVEMETVNGSLKSDFPLEVSGTLSPRHLRATIGQGGRELRLATVNGSVELRKLP